MRKHFYNRTLPSFFCISYISLYILSNSANPPTSFSVYSPIFFPYIHLLQIEIAAYCSARHVSPVAKVTSQALLHNNELARESLLLHTGCS